MHAQPSASEQLIQTIVRTFGKLNILANNTAIAW